MFGRRESECSYCEETPKDGKLIPVAVLDEIEPKMGVYRYCSNCLPCAEQNLRGMELSYKIYNG